MACSRTVVLSVVFLLGCVRCFNVDIENYVKHSGKSGSMFGFTVAEHKDRGTSWVLVGAPEAQTQQPGVSRGGAVFRCDVSRDDACQEVPFDLKGNNNDSRGLQLDRKSDQWFGASLSSSGVDGVIVACAPRYVWYSTRIDRRDPVGTCYVAKNSFSEFSEYSPCRTRNWGYHRQGSCQAGLGATVSKNGERLYVGAVGSWYWQGQLYSTPTDVRLDFLPPRNQDFGAPGQLFSQSLQERPQFHQTREGPAEDDDSYLGYSVIAGDFDGTGQPGVAVGMPRGHGLLGKVVLYTWDLQNTQNITGEQLGGYFGYSLCSVDVDGDKLDDLVIGAPMFTAETNKNEMKYETGRIYIVFQGTEDKFRYLQSRDGTNSKGRFGLSLASLGDINMDGYGDFAVGAPYDGPNERGAVYIYHGSKAGAMEKASQVIYAEDIQPQLSTFGFSLAGGLDLDENSYPDVVVGAYESATAVFLRSRPVIQMSAVLSFGSDSKLISLKERNCTIKDGTRVACIPLKGCMVYNGVGVDRRLDFEIQFILDSKKSRDVRMFFIDNEGRYSQNYSIKLDKGKQFCQTQIVYIKSSIRDKLTPLEAEMRYSLKTASGQVGGSTVGSSGRRVTRALKPILDQNVPAVEKDSINIEKNCGKDNICIPDLKLITTPSVDQYLLGSRERFVIDVVVENNGEDAFEAMYNLHLPPGMNYINTERIDDFEHEIPLQCSAPSPASNNTLKCDIGNPLPKRKVIHFKVLLAPFHKSGMKPRYEFFMDVNTTNPENKSSIGDNVRSLSIPIWVQTDHVVSGHPYPADVPYNMSQYRSVNITREAEIGPQVVHIYNIKNQGPSDIVKAEAFFVWPSHTQEDDELLYLLEQPQTTGNVRCEFVNEANALKLQLDNKNKKSFLELHGVIIDSSYNSGVTIEKTGSSFSKTTSSSSGSGSSIGGGTYVQTNKGQGADRNEISSHHGLHTLTDEERRILKQENEERLVHESSESRFSNSSSRSNQSSGGRVQGGGSSYQAGRTQGGGSITTEARGGQIGNGRVEEGGVSSQAGRTQGGAATGQGRGGVGQDGVSFQGGRTSNSGSTRTDQYSGQGGSGVGQGRGGTSQEAGSTYQGGRTQAGGSTRTDEYESRGTNQGRGGYQGGSYSGQGSRGQSGGSTVDERNFQSVGGGRVSSSQGGGSAGGYGEGSNIPEQEGTYLGGRARGTGGLTKLEQDYLTFGSSQGSRDREREEWRNSQASRAEWRASQGGRGSTNDYNSGESRGYGQGSRESSSSAGTYNQGGGGDYDARGRGYNAGVEPGYSQGSRTYSQGNSGDYSAGGTRLYNQGGSGSAIHEQYGTIRGGGNVGGQGETSLHESSHFTSTFVENGNAPRHYSNSSFSNSSSGGRNVSGSWQSGDDSISSGHLGNVGAGHSGSHETISSSSSTKYGNVRESNLERRGESGVSRSGYNVGNPSSAERTNWSKETRTQTSGSGGFDLNGGGGGVYNWTSSVSNFGLDNAGSRSGGEQSRSTSRQPASESERREPGINRRESKTEKQRNGDNDRDQTESRSGERSSSSSEHSSSKTHYEGGVKIKHSKELVSGDNTLEDIDSRFHAYKRFERSVSDLIDLDDKAVIEQAKRNKRSVDTGERWDQYQNDEGFGGDSVARQASNFELEKVLDCAVTKCSRMKCLVGPLKKDEEVFIGFRYRVWVRTLEKIGWNRASKLSTLMAARVTELPHVGEPFEIKLKTVEVPMEVFPTDVPVRPDIVPLWVVVLSACAGAIILLLLIFLLYKCGFFKRNRPTDSAEKEPLNRNGHYNSGDEAL